MNDFFNIAINEAEIAYINNEVPVGAVIVFNNEVICKTHNKRIEVNDVTAHAEILAIREAAKIIGDWRLDQCDLYVTLEPCSMCKEVVFQSRIRNVYYLLKKLESKKEFDKTSFQQINYKSLNNEYREKLSTFFQLKCKR